MDCCGGCCLGVLGGLVAGAVAGIMAVFAAIAAGVGILTALLIGVLVLAMVISYERAVLAAGITVCSRCTSDPARIAAMVGTALAMTAPLIFGVAAFRSLTP